MEWMLMPLKRYAQFRGRARRKEFWMWTLFVVIVTVVLSIVDSALGFGGRAGAGQMAAGPASFSYGAAIRGGLLANLFSLAVLIPNLAVAVRRLHDRDRSGWWILMPLLPYAVGFGLLIGGFMTANQSMLMLGGVLLLLGLVAAIVVLVWYCLPGTVGPNRFGADPMDVTNEHLAETFQ